MSSVIRIPFSEIQGLQVGNSSSAEGKTGVTVFYFPRQASDAVQVFGGGPASREISLLDPERNQVPVDALVLAGGSSFGLDASAGVRNCLESHGHGIDTGYARVPIVCQSDIFDLGYGSSDIRPDERMGFDACKDAMDGNHPVSGNAGAGIGATVGKACGMERAWKSGIGYAAARIGELVVGVAAVVNAYGDIFFHGRKIAGMTDPSRAGFSDAADALLEMQPHNLFTGNTTLAAVFTNASFRTSDLKKIINMASAGMARAIRPVFTMADGDTIYAFSIGGAKEVVADINVVGTLAADLLEEAVADAVMTSKVPEDEYLSNILKLGRQNG